MDIFGWQSMMSAVEQGLAVSPFLVGGPLAT